MYSKLTLNASMFISLVVLGILINAYSTKALYYFLLLVVTGMVVSKWDMLENIMKG